MLKRRQRTNVAMKAYIGVCTMFFRGALPLTTLKTFGVGKTQVFCEFPMPLPFFSGKMGIKNFVVSPPLFISQTTFRKVFT